MVCRERARGTRWSNNNNSGRKESERAVYSKLSPRRGECPPAAEVGGREKAPCLSTHVGDASYLYIVPEAGLVRCDVSTPPQYANEVHVRELYGYEMYA
jgi:hypothetical protein